MKRTLTVLLLAILAGYAGGAVETILMRGKIVAAEEIAIVDDTGSIRVLLDAESLVFLDAEGQPRIALRPSGGPDEKPTVELIGRNSDRAALLSNGLAIGVRQGDAILLEIDTETIKPIFKMLEHGEVVFQVPAVTKL